MVSRSSLAARRRVVVLVAATVAASALALPAAAATSDGRIVFGSSRDGNSGIYVMNDDGSNQINLTTGELFSHELDPKWSPDGSRVAFTSTRDANVVPYNFNTEIYVMNADGSNQTRLTNNSSYDSGPSWSPDGSKIAFVSDRHLPPPPPIGPPPAGPGHTDIYVMNSDGSNPVRLTNNTFSEGQPDWSPDGSKITFISDRDGNTEIYVMSADGSNQTRLTNNTAFDSGPSWSPDGSKIAFDTDRDGGTEADVEIYSMNADGSNQTRLTNNASLDAEPSWSPDGLKIAFATFRGANFEIYVMNSDGTGETNVTNHPSGDHSPDWSGNVTTTDSVGLVDPASGEWRLRNAAGLISQFFYGDPGDVPFMGDWDCDGVDTPGLFRVSDAFAYLRNSNSQGIADIRFFFGNPSDIPLAGDFDGNGCDSLSIYRPSEQRFYIINALGANNGGLGAADFSFVFGDPGDKPFVGDFDGDGIDEVGLHRESTGFVYYRNTLDTGNADNQFFFGDPGDRFVAGDWGTVDGTDTPGLFRPSNTTFFFRHTNTQGNADSQLQWGEPTWLPIAGNFGLD
jgi:Tol biopolymer transport system component